MKNSTYLFFILGLLVAFKACNTPPMRIAVADDYEKYLTASANPPKYVTAAQQNIDFWQDKIKNDQRGAVYLSKIAAHLEGRFRKSGNIGDLSEAALLLEEANATEKGKNVGILHSLSLNAVTRHAFKQAEKYLQQAQKLGASKAVTSLLMTDVQLELGNVSKAKWMLAGFKKRKDFDVLTRRAKLLDHEGNLDEAIKVMEKAWESVQQYQEPDFHTWTLTSLADMYGHSGQVQKAYQAYLQALAIDPEHDYALRGMAWIAYSHDKNPKEAKRILQFIRKRNQSPDLLLKLAEIADYEGDRKEKTRLLKAFKVEVEQPQYGEMYNSYLVNLYAEEWNNIPKAREIAEREIQNRPTAQTYDLLAWTYYCEKNYPKALEIAEKYVKGKSFEPDILLHLGQIYQANGKKAEAEKYFEEAKEAEFELGPKAL
jgi:tetratricopeptide (TPR) repeat protein